MSRPDPIPPERAAALRELLLETGRALGGEGVDRLRRALQAMAISEDRALRPAGRFLSAALGAALQMILEPGADLPALAASLDLAFALGLDSWFAASERSLLQVSRARPNNLIALRASGVEGPTAGERARIEDLLGLIRAGRLAARGDRAALEALEAMR